MLTAPAISTCLVRCRAYKPPKLWPITKYGPLTCLIFWESISRLLKNLFDVSYSTTNSFLNRVKDLKYWNDSPDWFAPCIQITERSSESISPISFFNGVNHSLIKFNILNCIRNELLQKHLPYHSLGSKKPYKFNYLFYCNNHSSKEKETLGPPYGFPVEMCLGGNA